MILILECLGQLVIPNDDLSQLLIYDVMLPRFRWLLLIIKSPFESISRKTKH
jgi:hypothetical protein